MKLNLKSASLLFLTAAMVGCGSDSIDLRGAPADTSSAEKDLTAATPTDEEMELRNGSIDSSDTFANVGSFILVEEGRATQHCTGTLIADRIVLTSAHCLGVVSANPLPGIGNRSRIGQLRFSLSKSLTSLQAEPAVAIDFRVVDPSFEVIRSPNTKTIGSDLALVLFDKSLKMPKIVHPSNKRILRLPTSDSFKVAKAGTSFETLGYGTDANAMSDFNSFDRKHGRMIFQGVDPVGLGEVRFSAGGPARRSQIICPGDSGGPIFQGNVIYALNSAVNNRSCFAVTAAYGTNVFRHSEWIANAIKELLGPPLVLPAPTNLTAIYQSNSRTTLTWKHAPVDGKILLRFELRSPRMGPFLPFDEGSDVLIASIHPNLRTVTYQSSRGVLGQKYIVRAVYEDGPSGSSNQAETLVGCSATVTVDDVLVDRAKVIRKVKKGDSYRIHGLGTMNQGSILRVDSKLKDQSGRPIYGDILITKLDIAKLSNVVCPR